MKPLFILLACAAAVARADMLTLTSGEIVEGEIVAASPAEYRVRVANEDFTITALRLIAPAEVQSVTRDTPAQKAELTAYEALCDYRRSADREQPLLRCQQAVAALEDFLRRHPQAATAPRVKNQLTGWQDERDHVAQGLVKFQNRWLTPDAKQAAVHEARQEAQRQATQRRAQQLQRQIADWEAHALTFSNALIEAEQNLTTATKALAALQDFTAPVYGYRPVGAGPTSLYINGSYLEWWPPVWEKYVAGGPRRGSRAVSRTSRSVGPGRNSADRRGSVTA